jgi:hypothetical protein
VINAALLGGLFIGILSALPIINVANCCCLWIIAGGALAAYLDRQSDPSPMTVGRGALAGLGAGVVGAFVWLLATMALDVVIGPLQERLIDEMRRSATDMPPEFRALIESIGARSSSPFRWVLGFILQLMASAIFATLGGALAALFFRRDVPPALGGPPYQGPPPPLPPSE